MCRYSVLLIFSLPTACQTWLALVYCTQSTALVRQAHKPQSMFYSLAQSTAHVRQVHRPLNIFCKSSPVDCPCETGPQSTAHVRQAAQSTAHMRQAHKSQSMFCSPVQSTAHERQAKDPTACSAVLSSRLPIRDRPTNPRACSAVVPPIQASTDTASIVFKQPHWQKRAGGLMRSWCRQPTSPVPLS